MRKIRLRYCELRYEPNAWLCTVFPDGSEYGAHPHATPHYHVIAHRCGYGDDLWRYCLEHEFAHSFVCEWLRDRPSLVLSEMAAGRVPDPGQAVLEEMAAQQFQRWLRANERPIVSGVDWDGMKASALDLLDGRPTKNRTVPLLLKVDN